MADGPPAGAAAVFALCEIFALALGFLAVDRLAEGKTADGLIALLLALVCFGAGIKWPTIRNRIKPKSTVTSFVIFVLLGAIAGGFVWWLTRQRSSEPSVTLRSDVGLVDTTPPQSPKDQPKDQPQPLPPVAHQQSQPSQTPSSQQARNAPARPSQTKPTTEPPSVVQIEWAPTENNSGPTRIVVSGTTPETLEYIRLRITAVRVWNDNVAGFIELPAIQIAFSEIELPLPDPLRLFPGVKYGVDLVGPSVNSKAIEIKGTPLQRRPALYVSSGLWRITLKFETRQHSELHHVCFSYQGGVVTTIPVCPS